MKVSIRNLVLACAAAGFLVVMSTAAGCILFPPSAPPRPVSNWTIQDAQEFADFELYWFGESYDGLPLKLIEHHPARGRQVQNIDIWYGEPILSSDPYSADWKAPLSIRFYSSCEKTLDQLSSFEEVAEDPYGLEVKNIHVRGVGGYVTRYSETAYSLSVWAGSSIITLSTSGLDLDIERAAEDLLSIFEDPGTRPGPLPRP